MNSKYKGDIAVGQAINYFIQNNFEVCLPIGNKKDYDFIIEKDNHVQRVQVKYAGIYSNKGKCIVGLRITGGNQSRLYAKKYAKDAFDLLFVYTEKGEKYVLPWKDITCRNEISLENSKYSRYKVS